MTKKDFEFIASIIARAERCADECDGRNPSPKWYADVFATELAAAHPRFDYARFELAALPLAAEAKRRAILDRLAAAK